MTKRKRNEKGRKRKDRRRSISLKGLTWQRLHDYCEANERA
jgi:macrodomain Ter protein organizer (MatP/YcbG family)